MFQPVAFTGKDQQVTVMHDTVDNGTGKLIIKEYPGSTC